MKVLRRPSAGRAKSAAKVRSNNKWESSLAIRPSRIRGAGQGLYAIRPLRAGQMLPVPYRGKALSKEQVKRLRDGSYLFLLTEDTPGPVAGLDARYVKRDNPLRYCNGARTPQQKRKVNVKASQRNGQVYFAAKRPIKSGEELIIDYGPTYWEGMRYQTRMKELRQDATRIKAQLRVCQDPMQCAELEEELARQRWDKEKLEDGSSSSSEESATEA